MTAVPIRTEITKHPDQLGDNRKKIAVVRLGREPVTDSHRKKQPCSDISHRHPASIRTGQ